MHHIDRFRHDLQQFVPMGTISFQQITDFAVWLRDDGIPLFKQAFKQETGQAVPSLPDGKLIEQAYPKSLNEIKKKQEQQVFYSANAQIFTETCSWIVLNVIDAHADQCAEPFASRHYELLKKLTLDALSLLADWAALTQGTPGIFGIGKNHWHDTFQISHAAEQLMFSGSPFFAFTDNVTDASTALLRIALETRLRFGFGLLGVLDKTTQTILPMNLSTVLTAVGAYEDKMVLAVPLQHIERLYGWSNIYVHVGLTHFTWSPIFAHRYLNSLFRGGRFQGGGSSIHAGIRINKATIAAIQRKAEFIYELDAARHELLRIDPENCSVVFDL